MSRFTSALSPLLPLLLATACTHTPPAVPEPEVVYVEKEVATPNVPGPDELLFYAFVEEAGSESTEAFEELQASHADSPWADRARKISALLKQLEQRCGKAQRGLREAEQFAATCAEERDAVDQENSRLSEENQRLVDERERLKRLTVEVERRGR